MNPLKIILSLAVVFGACSVIHADESFNDYMRSVQGEFQQFKDERDREFTAFLKEMWIEVETSKPEERIEKPKPLTIPVAPSVTPEPVPVPAPQLVVPQPETIPAPPVIPQPVRPEVIKGDKLEFDFYGSHIRLGYDPKLKLRLQTPVTGEAIGGFWEKAALSDYEPLVNGLVRYRDELKLSDWGFILLVNEAARRIAEGDNAKVLLGWFILSKAGYETRTAYDGGNVYLLVPANSKLYGVSYFSIDSKRYYTISADGFVRNLGNVYTYKKSYPDADNFMEFRIANYPELGYKTAERDLNFSYGGKTYEIKVPYNLNDIAYFRYHPQTDVTIYAEAGLPDLAGKTLLTQLAPIIKGKSELESINILLRFVQTAFAYKTDEEQFGYEKFFFAVETLYYPYSDCEDRSILFSYLVKNLLGLDLVFLEYPGHIATAVAVNESSGTSFIFDNKVYTVTDPTYINASAGMVMPQFAGVQPKIIRY